VILLLIIDCVCQLCNGPSRVIADSRRLPFAEQAPNTPTSASASLAPPSMSIVASCVANANVNMDASHFSVGLYDDFAVSASCICYGHTRGLTFLEISCNYDHP